MMNAKAWLNAGALSALLLTAWAGFASAESGGPATDNDTTLEEPTVTFSFKGVKNGAVEVTDHRTGETQFETGDYRSLNLMTKKARGREAEYREGIRERTEEIARERAKRAADAAELANEQAAAAPSPALEDPAAEKARMEAGLQTLRDQHWITYSSDDKNFPQQVFDPYTKQFIPAKEAVDRLQKP